MSSNQEKSIETALSPTSLAQNELRDALFGDEISFLALPKEYGNDCALDYFDLFESIEQVAVEEEWSYERQQVQTEGSIGMPNSTDSTRKVFSRQLASMRSSMRQYRSSMIFVIG